MANKQTHLAVSYILPALNIRRCQEDTSSSLGATFAVFVFSSSQIISEAGFPTKAGLSQTQPAFYPGILTKCKLRTLSFSLHGPRRPNTPIWQHMQSNSSAHAHRVNVTQSRHIGCTAHAPAHMQLKHAKSYPDTTHLCTISLQEIQGKKQTNKTPNVGCSRFP